MSPEWYIQTNVELEYVIENHLHTICTELTAEQIVKYGRQVAWITEAAFCVGCTEEYTSV